MMIRKRTKKLVEMLANASTRQFKRYPFSIIEGRYTKMGASMQSEPARDKWEEFRTWVGVTHSLNNFVELFGEEVKPASKGLAICIAGPNKEVLRLVEIGLTSEQALRQELAKVLDRIPPQFQETITTDLDRVYKKLRFVD